MPAYNRRNTVFYDDMQTGETLPFFKNRLEIEMYEVINNI